jgi:O-antigen/teichoic acid export membrane protein
MERRPRPPVVQEAPIASSCHPADPIRAPSTIPAAAAALTPRPDGMSTTGPEELADTSRRSPAGPADDELVAPDSLFRNSSALLLARLVALICGGGLTIYAVRVLSLEEYGAYSIAIALTTLFGLLSEMGISALTLRELVKQPERRAELFAVSMGAEVATTVVAICVMLPVALLLGYSSLVVVLVAIGGLALMFQAPFATVEAGFKSRRVMTHVGVALVVQASVSAAVSLALLLAGLGPEALMIGLAVGAAAGLAVGVWLLRRKLAFPVGLDLNLRHVLKFVRAGSMIAATGAVTVIYERVDVLMLSKLDGEAAVALYSLAFMVIQYVLMVPTIVGSAFFPMLIERLKGEPETARAEYGLMIRLFLFISIPASIALMLGGGEMIRLIFGERYAGSGEPMRVFAWICTLGFLNALFWYGILASYKERAMIALMVGALAVNVLINALLIPPLGPLGAAIGLVGSYVLIVGGELGLIRRHLFRLPLGPLVAKPLMAGAVSAAVAVPLFGVSELAAGLAGAGAFTLALLGLRYISAEEWRPLTVPLTAMLRRAR